MIKESQKNSYFERKSKGLFRRQKVKLKHWLGWLGVPQLIPYRGFGSCSSKNVFVYGMLTENKGLEKPKSKQSAFENIVSMIKRYSGDQIPGARLSVEFEDQKQEIQSSDNGLYHASFPLSDRIPEKKSTWINYKVQILDRFDEELNSYEESGEILVPGTAADFAVISDIDDTIMVSHSTHVLRKLRLLLTHNSRTRKPFAGVDAFYRALSAGKDEQNTNPFFYISSSEWNLYDLIDDFCNFNQFPKGVFLLREINPGILNVWKQGGKNHEHKYEKIMHLFKTYPELKFVLVGDNGQRDPDIYTKVASQFPKRVKAIYIRTISKRKDRQMQQFILEMKRIGVPMVFTSDSINAAQHAAGMGLISSSSVQQVIQSSIKN